MRELSCGELEQVYVKGDAGYVVLMQVGHETVLEVIAGDKARLGMVLLNMRHAVSELRHTLENPHPEQAKANVKRLDSSPRVVLPKTSNF